METDMPAGLTNDGIARTFYGLAIAIMIGVIAYIGRGVLIPLVVAGFLCFLIFTLKENIKRAPLIGKFLPDWLCYLFAFMLIGAGAMIFVEIIKANVETLLETWPSYETRLNGIVQFSPEILIFYPRSFLAALSNSSRLHSILFARCSLRLRDPCAH